MSTLPDTDLLLHFSPLLSVHSQMRSCKYSSLNCGKGVMQSPYRKLGALINTDDCLSLLRKNLLLQDILRYKEKRTKFLKATEFRIKLLFCLLLALWPQSLCSQSLNSLVKWAKLCLSCKTVVRIKIGKKKLKNS